MPLKYWLKPSRSEIAYPVDPLVLVVYKPRRDLLKLYGFCHRQLSGEDLIFQLHNKVILHALILLLNNRRHSNRNSDVPWLFKV